MGCDASSQIASADPNIPTIVAFIGLSGTGKTTFIEYLAGEYDPEFPPISTIGTYIREIHIQNRSFLVFDTCGLICHVEEWLGSIDKADALVMTFDPPSINFASITLAQIFKLIGPAIAMKKIPILVLMTKTKDLNCTQFKIIDLYLQSYFKDNNYIVRALEKPDDSIFENFQWIIDNTTQQLEK